jgi:hypothetical protein
MTTYLGIESTNKTLVVFLFNGNVSKQLYFKMNKKNFLLLTETLEIQVIQLLNDEHHH